MDCKDSGGLLLPCEAPQNYRKIQLISKKIYLFLRKRFESTKYAKEISAAKDKVGLIAKYKNKDRACKETFKLYTRFYARIAKNLVLDSLATGGLYIAGGIALKNREIFKSKEFIREFENVNTLSILKRIPIFLIADYNVSLYGAAYLAKERLLK